MQFKATTRTPSRLQSPAAFAGGGFALIALVVGTLWAAQRPERVREPLPRQAPAPAIALAPAPRATLVTPPRPVFRHSVIPGGVHGAAELASRLARDPVARVHYANFDVAGASLVRVEKPRLVHVSYRIGDKIYWTKNKVRLAAGEELLSDGTQQVRTRCGNRIADSRQAAESDNEPAPEVLDALMVSADDLLDLGENLAAAAAAAGTTVGLTNFTAPAPSPTPTLLLPSFTAPAATLLASGVQGVTPFGPHVMPVLVSSDTSLPTSAPAQAQSTAAAPVPVAAAQPGHSDDAPAAVVSSPPSPSAASIPATPAPSLPIRTLPAGPLGHGAEPAGAATPASQPVDAATPIPEPGSAVLAVIALIALAAALAGRRAAGKAS